MTAVIDERIDCPATIKQCKKVGPTSRSFGHLWGWSGLTIEDCDFRDLAINPNDSPFFLRADPEFWGVRSGIPQSALRPGVVRDVVVRNNFFSNTEGQVKQFAALLLTTGGGSASGVTFAGNTFHDQQNPDFAALGVIADDGPISDVQIVGNTFSGAKTRSGILLDGSFLSGVLVSGNTWLGTYDAADPAPAVLAQGLTTACSLVANDYRSSGHPRVGASSSDAVILLESDTTFNTVFESGSFPPGQGGAATHVVSRNASNRIVGEPAHPGLFEPGIGGTLELLHETPAADE